MVVVQWQRRVHFGMTFCRDLGIGVSPFNAIIEIALALNKSLIFLFFKIQCQIEYPTLVRAVLQGFYQKHLRLIVHVLHTHY